MQKISIRTQITGAALSFLVALLGLLGSARQAAAVPSFARQTGLPCASCHVGWPELTPFGRAFKANGFVWGGGKHPFPLAMMVQAPTFTHTAAGQPGGAAPGYGANDNFEAEAVSLFYGGAIYEPIGLGALVQGTYSGGSNSIGWDNSDIRLAKNITSGPFAGFASNNVVVGVTLNNNPSVSDLWNTTPAWRWPFIGADLAPSPTAGTLIEGGLAQLVLGGGPYVWWNNLFYAELDGYRTLPNGTLRALGEGTPISPINNVTPYWRVAITPSWNKSNYLEIGTFGLSSDIFPGGVTIFGPDHLTDVAVDTQYQYIRGKQYVGIGASYITEFQNWAASYPLGLTANNHDRLNSFNIKASYMYDQTYEGSIGYFNITGNRDAGLYSPAPISGSANGSPNSGGFTFEFDYMPWNYGSPWPYTTLNVKLGIQYTAYTEFNGGGSNYDGYGRNASDNNTLFLFAWLMF